MAQKLLGIEISDTAVRYVYLEQVQGSWHVLHADQMTAKINLSNPGQTLSHLNAICEKEHIRPQRVFMTLNRSDVFIHQVIVPKIKELEAEEVLEREIENLPAFHHEQFDYIYKASPHPGNKYKTIFAALPHKIVEYIRQDLITSKVLFGDLEIAPLNIFGVLSLIRPLCSWEAVLCVSSHHSTLCIQEKQNLRLCYRSSTGSHVLSQHHTAVGPRHAYSLWTGELNRVIKSFLLENPKVKLNTIWVVWDKDVLKNLEEALLQDLGLRVEVPDFSKIRGIQSKALNPIFGLSLTPVIHHVRRIREQFPLNHFLNRPEVLRSILKTATVTVAFMGLCLGLFLKISLDLNHKIARLDQENNALTQEISALTVKSEALLSRQKEFLTVRQKLLDQATSVNQLNRVSWSQIFAIFSRELPGDLALSSFRFGNSGKAEIKGDALSMDAIAAFIRRIDDSKILEQGKFDFLTEKKLEDLKYFSFGILAELRSAETGHDEKFRDEKYPSEHPSGLSLGRTTEDGKTSNYEKREN